jgi:serine/threonine-protein kinase RsbW
MSSHLEVMEFVIPSDFRYLGAVDAAFQDLAREFSCSQSCVNDVGTAIIEACSNAIEHGNQFSKDKRVKVVIGLNGETIIARIYDEGNGFDFKTHLSDSAPPEPQSERGRGIIIMKAFTDELNYTFAPQVGLCIELKKSRAGEHGDAPGD